MPRDLAPAHHCVTGFAARCSRSSSPAWGWSRVPPTSACDRPSPRLFGDPAEPARTVVLELRAPRLLSAFTIGALLALAGVLLQALFRNPLADSYVLGVSGGSSVGALFALLLGASLWAVQCSAAARRDCRHVPRARAGARWRHGARAAHRCRGGQRLRRAGHAGAGAGRQRPAARHDVLAGRRPRLGGAPLGDGRRRLVSHAGRDADRATAGRACHRRNHRAEPGPRPATLAHGHRVVRRRCSPRARSSRVAPSASSAW